MTAVRQIERLGYQAAAVRHIVLTQLEFDHAGGLDDFPKARVHLMRKEQDAADRQKTWLDRQRYRPEQWSNRARWHVYDGLEGEMWNGLSRVRALHGISDEVLLVPLPSHTLGHAGVAVRTGPVWTLMAGDAYLHHSEIDADQPYCPPGLRMYQALMQKDRRARLSNQTKLRTLKREHGNSIQMFSVHDPVEFERVTGRPVDDRYIGSTGQLRP